MSYGLIFGMMLHIHSTFFCCLNSVFIQYRITYTNKPTDKQSTLTIFKTKREQIIAVLVSIGVVAVSGVAVDVTVAFAVDAAVCLRKEECTVYTDRTTGRPTSGVDYLK